MQCYHLWMLSSVEPSPAPSQTLCWDIWVTFILLTRALCCDFSFNCFPTMTTSSFLEMLLSDLCFLTEELWLLLVSRLTTHHLYKNITLWVNCLICLSASIKSHIINLYYPYILYSLTFILQFIRRLLNVKRAKKCLLPCVNWLQGQRGGYWRQQRSKMTFFWL